MFLIIILFPLLLVFFLFIYGWESLKPYNQSPLVINTFDGTNSPYHPSVINIESYFPGKYKYMMSETPFCFSRPSFGEDYRDQYECPSIHYSSDGVIWEELFNNPIDSLNQINIKDRDYFSDPDLVVTPGGIECWYRINRRYGKETNQENISLLRKVSLDGVNWTEREELVNCEIQDSDKGIGRIVISQGVLYENGYKCWYIDNIHLGREEVCYSFFDELKGMWSDKKGVRLKGPKTTPWHLHIMKDGDAYWLTLYDHKNISIWRGTSELEFDYVKTVLTPCNRTGSFYSHNLYRACLIKICDNRWRLYFSADDMFKSYIGIMEGDSPSSLKVVSADGKQHIFLKEFLPLVLKTRITILNKKYQLNKNRVSCLLHRGITKYL